MTGPLVTSRGARWCDDEAMRISTSRAVALTFPLWGLLVACGGSDATDDDTPLVPTKTIEIVATEYQFAGDSGDRILAGEVVLLRMRNEGEENHELQVLDGNGRLIDRTVEVVPGSSGEVTIAFEEPGVYQFICDVDDHLTRGQKLSFEVPDS